MRLLLILLFTQITIAQEQSNEEVLLNQRILQKLSAALQERPIIYKPIRLNQDQYDQWFKNVLEGKPGSYSFYFQPSIKDSSLNADKLSDDIIKVMMSGLTDYATLEMLGGGSSSGGGGDFIRPTFIKIGQMIISELRKGKYAKIVERNNLDIEKINSTLDLRKIFLTDRKLLDGGSLVSALGSEGKIILNAQQWDNILKNEPESIKFLIFHEMLRAAGIDDNDYKISLPMKEIGPQFFLSKDIKGKEKICETKNFHFNCNVNYQVEFKEFGQTNTKNISESFNSYTGNHYKNIYIGQGNQYFDLNFDVLDPDITGTTESSLRLTLYALNCVSGLCFKKNAPPEINNEINFNGKSMANISFRNYPQLKIECFRSLNQDY